MKSSLLSLAVTWLAPVALVAAEERLQVILLHRPQLCNKASAHGDVLRVHYKAFLDNGTQFDDSTSRDPFEFQLGTGHVIAGWEKGLENMCEGERRRLYIPQDMAYGERGAGDIIPPRANLIFEVDLVEMPGKAKDFFLDMDPPIRPKPILMETMARSKVDTMILSRPQTCPISAQNGDVLTVHYTGYLTSFKKFDSSIDREDPFQFRLGSSQVIPGWEEGVAGMCVGERRRLTIPPSMAYGKQGVGNIIPPNSTIIFDIQLLRIN